MSYKPMGAKSDGCQNSGCRRNSALILYLLSLGKHFKFSLSLWTLIKIVTKFMFRLIIYKIAEISQLLKKIVDRAVNHLKSLREKEEKKNKVHSLIQNVAKNPLCRNRSCSRGIFNPRLNFNIKESIFKLRDNNVLKF